MFGTDVKQNPTARKMKRKNTLFPTHLVRKLVTSPLVKSGGTSVGSGESVKTGSEVLKNAGPIVKSARSIGGGSSRKIAESETETDEKYSTATSSGKSFQPQEESMQEVSTNEDNSIRSESVKLAKSSKNEPFLIASGSASREEKPGKKQAGWSEDLSHIALIRPSIHRISRLSSNTELPDIEHEARERSMSRLGETALEQASIDFKGEHRSSKTLSSLSESMKQATPASSLKKELLKLSTALQRQMSELNLHHTADSSASSIPSHDQVAPLHHRHSTYMVLGDYEEEKNFCTFPGWVPGEDCHTVAATVLAKGKLEFHPSSSSSSDDVYESTRYAKDILKEKLRGQERSEEKKEGIAQGIKKLKSAHKSPKKKSCFCQKNSRHDKCFVKTKSLRNEHVSGSDESGHAQEISSNREPESSTLLDPDESEVSHAMETNLDEALGSEPSLVPKPEPPSEEKRDKMLSPGEIPCYRDTCQHSKPRRHPKRMKCQLKAAKSKPKKVSSHLKPKHVWWNTFKRMPCRKAKRRLKHKQLTCKCHKFGVDMKGADFVPSYRDSYYQQSSALGLSSAQKRFSCGGFVKKNAQCCCHMCSVIKKPWNRLKRHENTLIDLPYRLTNSELEKRMLSVIQLRTSLEGQISTLQDFCKRSSCSNVAESVKEAKNELLERMFHRCPKGGAEAMIKVPPKPNLAKLGYFVEVKDEGLTRGEHFTSIQQMAEAVVYCRWMQDTAEMKVNYFLNNLPPKQSCFPDMNRTRQAGRTCYNLKLIERLADLVQFNTATDRSLHEYSTIPKFIRFQEPQVIGGSDIKMPEVKPLSEEAKFPTIYRDLFKDRKREQREILDALVPPLQWFNNAGLWEMKASLHQDGNDDNQTRIKQIDYNDTLCQAVNKNFCSGRYRLFFEAFSEVIRQEVLDCPERASMLAKIREELLMTLLLYDGGLEISLSAANVGAEDPSVNEERDSVLETWKNEIQTIKKEINAMKTSITDLEKRSEEQGVVRHYLFDDEEKHWKMTNHLLEAQHEAILAGLLYDLD